VKNLFSIGILLFLCVTSLASGQRISTNLHDELQTDLVQKVFENVTFANILIHNGSSLEWDEHIREIGNLLFINNISSQKYKFFYPAYKGEYSQNNVFVGYATSEDGINWMKHGKIIERSLEDPYIIYSNSTYHLFAEDKGDVPFRNIRKYHSYDCEHWIDDGVVLKPVMKNSKDLSDTFMVKFYRILDMFNLSFLIKNSEYWEMMDVSSPVVVIDENGRWNMLYEGRGGGTFGKIGLAMSYDGTNWTRYNRNPIIDRRIGLWDDINVVPDDIIKLNDTYYFLYHGYNKSSESWGMCLATSTDLKEWRKSKKNPICNNISTLMISPVDYSFFGVDENGSIGRFYHN
jgi:hypothetical protein